MKKENAAISIGQVCILSSSHMNHMMNLNCNQGDFLRNPH